METHFMDKFCKTCCLEKTERTNCNRKDCPKFCKPWFILYNHHTAEYGHSFLKRTTNAKEALDFFIEREKNKLRDYLESGSVLIITDRGQRFAHKESCIKEYT